MPMTLNREPVATVLHRMLTAEDQNDATAFAEAGAATPDQFPFEMSAERRAEQFKDVYMSVSAAGGELLYLLARATGARSVVEYGTSFGVSAIYLACAVRDNGSGRVIGTELQAGKAASAQQNLTAAGVADLVDLRVGDARDTLCELPGPVDFLLLDGWPDLALPVLRVVEPWLRAGALVLVDDVDFDFGRDVHRELLDYVADPANGYFSLRLPVADGIQACLKLG